MQKLNIKLENCYGIKKLEKEFDFSQNRTFSIYAPNGVMKTSFAKVFSKFQAGLKKDLDDIKDNVFGIEPVFKEITVDGVKIKKDEIFVIPSFESYYESKNMASLLIDDVLKLKIQDILNKRDNFFKLLENISDLKLERTSSGKKTRELEEYLQKDFEITSFLQNLDIFNLDIDYDFSSIKYSDIFDESIK
jgi:hypothetical protein